MLKASAIPQWQRALVVLTGTVVAVVVLAALYWAQIVFIPVALAIFLAFVLNPAVRALQRRGVGRILSVLAVVALAAMLLGGLSWLIVDQVTGLMARLPDYTANMRERIRSLRQLGAGSERLGKMVDDLRGELKAEQRAAGPGPKAVVPSAQPAAVVLQPETPAWLGRLPTYVGSVAEFAGALVLALVLVVFMLLNREDLRNRFLRLVGSRRMSFTTKAVDEASQRVSRYLLMQAAVNTALGLILTIGLWVIGVAYAPLWGFLAAVLRYVPYVGPCIAAVFPFTLSLAMFEGWRPPLVVLGLFLVVELITSNVLEPALYGHSMGVSGVAQLVSAALWAFLWGPIGLVLSAPLTVCLLVLGKYVPQLEFLDVLLGDEPALEPDISYYQRLLARDQDDATQVVLDRIKRVPPEQVYDDLLLPALTYASRGSERGELTESDEQFVCQATREILEDLGERRSAALADAGTAPDSPAEEPFVRVHVLVCPARDEADELGAQMLRQLLDRAKWHVEVTALETLTAELVTQVAQQQPALVCIAALPPGGLAHTRYLCKRLRARFPEMRILVGRWGLKDNVEGNQQQLQDAGADLMVTTLLETRNHLTGWLPVLTQDQARAMAV